MTVWGITNDVASDILLCRGMLQIKLALKAIKWILRINPIHSINIHDQFLGELCTRKVLLQCPQETRAPDGWGSGLAGP